MQLLRYCICLSRASSKEVADRETAQREHARGVRLGPCGPSRVLETVPEVAEAFRFCLRMAELSTSGSNREL